MVTARPTAPRPPDAVPDALVSGPQSLDFEALYDRHAPLVARIAMRILGTADDVDDVVQEVFMIAARSLHSIRSRDNPAGWLATITVRRVHRKLQRGKLRAFFGTPVPLEVERLIAPSADPGARILVRRIFEALGSVSVSERIAWSLRYIDGETIEEVAAVCRCSLSTAKRRIAAAQRKIEGELGHG